jgi:hypothetical protein
MGKADALVRFAVLVLLVLEKRCPLRRHAYRLSRPFNSVLSGSRLASG